MTLSQRIVELTQAVGADIKALLTDKQDADNTLTALANLATSADKMIYATGADQFALTPLTAFIRTLLDDGDAATARVTLGAAPLVSPALTGTPTAPTAPVGTNTTQVATTAFVNAKIAADRPFEATAANIKMDGTQAAGTRNTVARGDHVHPTDTSRAPLASPVFTGTPTAPTTPTGTKNTQIVNGERLMSEFVGSYKNPILIPAGADLNTYLTPGDYCQPNNSDAVSGSNYPEAYAGLLRVRNVGSSIVIQDYQVYNSAKIYTRTYYNGWVYNGGAWTLQATKPAVAAELALKADAASPALTGKPTAPTAPVGTNNTQIANTAFVQNELNSRRYVSGELTMTNGGQIVVNHGLGVEPTHISLYMKCAVAELGYAVGDVIRIAGESDPNGVNEAIGVLVNNAQIVLRVGEAGPQLVTRKDNGSAASSTAANWRLIVKASL